jgi:hypothetical protein
MEKIGAFAIKNGLSPTEVAVEQCDNFAHQKHTSFSLGTDVSYCGVLQAVALPDAVRESSGRRVL